MIAAISIAVTGAAALAAGIFLLLRSLLTIQIDACFGHLETCAVIRIIFWKKERYCLRVDRDQLMKWLTELPEDQTAHLFLKGERVTLRDVADWRRLCKELIRSVRPVCRTGGLRFSRVSWKTEYGSGDAAETAVLCGLIWSVQSMLHPLLTDSKNVQVCIDVVPLFQEKRFESWFSCMMTIRAGEAMTVMMKIRQQQKEGVANGRSSDTGADENST
jgi:Protein of unknown function (DUF2953).